MSVKLRFGLIIVLALAALTAAAKDDSGKKRTKRTRTAAETVEKKSVRSEPVSQTGGGDLAAGGGIPVAAANRGVGVELFDGEHPLWESSPVEVIRRMKLPMPKGAENEPVLSVVTRRKSSFCGCGVEEFRFFGREGKLVRIDVMFLNKGDSVKGKVPSSKKYEFSRRLQHAERDVTKCLDAAFGSSVNGAFGSGRQTQRVTYWFCREAAIAVEMEKSEFLMLHIIPREQSARRKVQRSTNRLDRTQLELTKHIRREQNGDVFIEGIPMVDQGSKGYCVPATLERYFRYYGITDFDMHRIAEAGKTKAGGGTVLTSAIAGLTPMLQDCRLRRVSCGRLRMRTVSHYVDEGLPLIWALYSSPEYVNRLKEFNAARGKGAGGAEWQKQLRKMRKIHASKSGAHVCLIIGYNAATNELAVSNSWGAGAEIAWVRYADAAVADAGEELYVLQPR